MTVQSNNNLQSVSPTGVESVKKAGIIFSTVDPEVMLVKAKELGYALVDEQVNQLPNGKVFMSEKMVSRALKSKSAQMRPPPKSSLPFLRVIVFPVSIL